MEVDILDPSPAYTPAFTTERSSIGDDMSIISSVPSLSAGLNLTPDHIKAHLRLLRAFQALKWRVQDPDSYPEVASKIPPRARSLNPNERWVWFLQLAVERFTRWVLKLDVARFVHPPIDVWMVWHSYMLNPLWYVEDCERLRLLRPLKNLRAHPIDILVHTEGDLLDYRSYLAQEEEEWAADTQLPYDPFESCAVLQDHRLDCPNCGHDVVAPYLSDTGSTGYAQKGFFINCGACNFRITREALAIAKFARDLVLDPTNPDDFFVFKCAVYLPGTLLDYSGRLSANTAKESKDRLNRAEALRNCHSKRDCAVTELIDRDAWERDVKRKLNFSIIELRKNLDMCLLPSKVKKVMSAYTDDKPFSVNLVAAVLRQVPFTDKLYHLGWLNSEFFDTDAYEKISYHCILRYQGFLSLIASLPDSFFVPSIDIDFAWHTHLLSPANYILHCREFVGKFINHDDHTGGQSHTNGFDYTAQAWQKQYSTPYTQCSCPDPSGREKPTKLFGIRSRQKPSSVHGNNCSISAQPSLHPWVKLYGPGPPTSPVAAANGVVEKQKRRTSYERGNTALMVPGPLYLGY